MKMITFVLFQFGIVPQQLIETAAKSEQDQGIDEEELYDVDNHATQRYLQWSQMWIYGEYVNQLEIGKYHAGGKGTFGQKHRIKWMPMFSWKIGIYITIPKITL